MDSGTRDMIAQAYDETVAEALSQGHAADQAHREGITAASMFLAAMNGLEDAAARSAVESLGLSPH